ncbi:MAG TPA: YCF48-related protein [Ktedonobacterales bacterium]|nr:YCF48-related protein [Ktedonobacterales bacterium]
MAQNDEPLSPREPDAIDEWVNHTLRERPLQPGNGSEMSDAPLIQELQQFYQTEAQAVDRRLERVWQRLEQRAATPQSQRETLPQVLPIFPQERRYRSMRNPLSAFHAPQHWSARIGALVAAVLLVALVGGLAFGLVLVRHNGPNSQTAHGSTTTPTPPPTPAPTNPPTGALSFTNIDMMNATEGWATAYSNPVVSGEPTQILHTTDGGVHWKNVTPHAPAASAQSSAALSPLSDGATPRTEDFLTGSAAWVLQLPNHLFKTTDGGATWQAETAPGDSLRQFTFLDAQHGWVITEANGTVGTFRTTDGGTHWTRMQSSANAFPLQTRFWGVRFLNLTTGWAAFINNSAGATAAVYKTTDSGATWHLQQIAMPAGAIPPVFFNAPVFFNDQDGMMEVMFGGINGQLRQQIANVPASGGAPEAIYVTRDGGATWQGPIILQGLEFPHFIDVQHGWALNSNGSGLLTTSDSGRHWATVPTSANFNQIDSLDFVSSQEGWALQYDDSSGGYFLLKTEDGGHTWTQLNVNISQ